jgi:hypothetical protein
MATYPELASGAVTRPVQSALSPSEIASPYNMLAEGLKKTGMAADTVASSMAEQEGAKAVVTGPDGSVQVTKAPYIGPAAEHYYNSMKFVALAEAEGAARRKDIELRTQFRDDPEGYNNAATHFMDQLQKQYTDAAGPLVGASVRKAVELTTTQTYKGLLTEKEHLDLYRFQYTMQTEMEYEQNRLAALAGQGVTDGPEVERSIKKIKSIQNQLLSNPRTAYTPQMAANDMEKIVSENQARAAEYRAAQVFRDPNGGYNKAIELGDRIRTDPELNLSPARREMLANRVYKTVDTLARDDQRIALGIDKQIEAINKLAFDTGSPVAPEQRAAIRTQIEQLPNRTYRELLQKSMDGADRIADAVQSLQRASPAQLYAYRDQVEAMMREQGSTSALEESLKSINRTIKSMNEGLTKEPLEYLNRTGRMKIDDLDINNPASMANRAAAVHTAESNFGVSLPMLKNAEKQALEHATIVGGKEMTDLAGKFVQGFGVDAPRAMADLVKSAPVFSQIGNLKINGGDEGFINDAAAGVALLHDPEQRKQLPKRLTEMSNVAYGAQSARLQDQYGSAFVLMPEQSRTQQETANSAFLARAIRNHYDPELDQGSKALGVKAGASEKAYDLALQQAAGAHFVGNTQYGGVANYRAAGGFLDFGGGGFFGQTGKVVVPPSVKADRFRDVIGAITDEDLRTMAVSPMKPDGTPYRAVDLRNALPVKTSKGYAFAQGDPTSADPKWIGGQLGGPFVLDFNQMEDRLRRRMPDAFMNAGGRMRPQMQ